MAGTLEKVRILHIEDNPGDALLLKTALTEAVRPYFGSKAMPPPSWDVTRVRNCQEAKTRLAQGDIDVILLDLNLPDQEGLEALREIERAAPRSPIVILSGRTEIEGVSETLQGGAQDYLVKGQVDGTQIWRSIRFAVERQHLRNHDIHVLDQSEEGFRSLMEMSIDGVAIFRKDAIVAANSAFGKLLGHRSQDTLGKPVGFFCDPDYLSYFQAQLERGSEAPMVVFGRKKDGSPLNLEFNVKSCLFEGEPARVIHLRDVTTRSKQEDQLLQRAYMDPVTGLPNRFLFFDRLQTTIQQATRIGGRIGLMFLDLDRFKLINDTLGHQVGDELIRAVALRLQGLLRQGDTLARLGGDEFTVLLPNLGAMDEVNKMSHRILDSLSKPFQLQRHELHTSASIGISFYPDDATDPDKLLQRADMAMYRAKESGRNNFQAYHDSMNISNLERLEMENLLFQAMDRGEFDLFYQPQVDLATGRLVGMEALLRWNHPAKGPINPAEFIPLAEETGLIIPLGQWVIQKACRQARAWQDQGLPPVRISINLSGVQFLKHTLPFLIDKCLKDAKLDPKWLEFEITESIAMRNPDFTLATLREMTEVVKVRVALDDFGIAYSSLGYLKDFPIHSLKIDKSFVADLGRGTKDEAIVSAIMVLARNLGLEVIVEGVENEAQMAFLRGHPGVTVQGYFFHPPLSPNGIEALLRGQA